MTRSLSRIRAGAALALVVAAVAAPAAFADTPAGNDQLSISAPSVDKVTPDARDAAAPVFWATPAASTPAPPVASSGNDDWVTAGVIVLLALFAAGTLVAVRLRRRSIPVA